MPRTKEQFKEMREKSKKVIIDVAKEMFAYKGYHSTSVNAIAKKAGIAVGLIYNYYPSKEALLKAIMASSMLDYNNRMAKLVKKPVEALDLKEMVLVLEKGIVKEVETWLLFIRAMTEVSGMDFSDLEDDLYFNCLEEVALSYYKEKNVEKAEAKTDLICDLVYGQILNFVIGGDEEAFRRTLEQMVQFML